MSILDINRAMAAYAQPTQFDQNAWKMAFDISNAFANTSETHLKNRENLATSDWRVAYQNNQFDNGIKQNDLKTADLQRLYANNQLLDPIRNKALISQNTFEDYAYGQKLREAQGNEEYVRAIADYGYDEVGRFRSPEEMFSLARSEGALTNPYAINKANEKWQNYYRTMAGITAPINVETASNYGMQAGGGIGIDAEGNVYLGNTNNKIAEKLSPEQQQQLLQRLYGPPMGAKEAEIQQRHQNALKEIEARANTAQAKQNNWQEHSTVNKLQADLGKLMNIEGMVVYGENGERTVNKTMFDQWIVNQANIYRNNPQALALLKQYADETAIQNGWKY